MQGHGDVFLRGEMKTIIGMCLDDLDKVEAHVDHVIRNGLGFEALLSLLRYSAYDAGGAASGKFGFFIHAEG